MGPTKNNLKASPSTSKIVKSGWLGKPKSNSCKKCPTIKSLTEVNCVICLNQLRPNNVMLPKCQHTFCRKCIFSNLNRDGKTSVQMFKLGTKKVVMDYLDLRESPSQSPADFFYKSTYTASLFHACNVGIDGRLQTGKVRMTDRLRKHCNLNQR